METQLESVPKQEPAPITREQITANLDNLRGVEQSAIKQLAQLDQNSKDAQTQYQAVRGQLLTAIIKAQGGIDCYENLLKMNGSFPPKEE